MSSPKKPMPESVATRLANPLPQQAGPDRRTAALPQAHVPIAAPHARTMEWDAYGPGGPGKRAPLHTIMSLPRQPEPRSQIGRWIGGPIVAALVAALTVWLSGIVNPVVPPVKNLGRLRLSSEPEGATVFIEGKVHPQATPTTIEGEIGATLRINFKLAGYLDKEADVFVGDGERPFRARLEKRDPVMPPPDLVRPIPEPEVVVPPRKEHVAPKPVVKHVPTVVLPTPIGPTGTLSVHVRPWAIVFIDGAKIHQTPVDGQVLGPGLHRLELVNEDIKKREVVTVEVRANGNEEVRRNWEK